jgi:hypothetical protein
MTALRSVFSRGDSPWGSPEVRAFRAHWNLSRHQRHVRADLAHQQPDVRSAGARRRPDPFICGGGCCALP